MHGDSPRVFLSYRREDTRHVAGRLTDQLRERFRLFVDVETVQPGANFMQAVYQAVDESDVFLALIGPQWATLRDKSGRRRLDDPGDWVANEIFAALTRKIVVIPVLVDDAEMPTLTELPLALTGLASRQAVHLRHESFRDDVDRLANSISRLATRRAKDTAQTSSVPMSPDETSAAANIRAPTPEPPARAHRRRPSFLHAAIFVAVMLAAVALVIVLFKNPGSDGAAAGSPATTTRATLDPRMNLALGDQVTFERYTITVRRVSVDPDQGLLLLVKLCINKHVDPGPDGKVRATWDPWSVTMSNQGTFRPSLQKPTKRPANMFPADSYHRPGECEEGRIPFSGVGPGLQLTRVDYRSPLGDKASWIR